MLIILYRSGAKLNFVITFNSVFGKGYRNRNKSLMKNSNY